MANNLPAHCGDGRMPDTPLGPSPSPCSNQGEGIDIKFNNYETLLEQIIIAPCLKVYYDLFSCFQKWRYVIFYCGKDAGCISLIAVVSRDLMRFLSLYIDYVFFQFVCKIV